MIVLGTDVREQNMLGLSVVLLPYETADRGVREMAETTHQARFQIPWIWTPAQHFKVMIRFENQHVAAAQHLDDGVRHITNVGELRDLHSATCHCERNGFGRVMRYAKRDDLDVPNFKCDSRL